MNKALKRKVIAYIKDHKAWTEEEETKALLQVDHMRCPFCMAGCEGQKILDNIEYLLNEFAEANELDEDFWHDAWDDLEEVYWALED